MKHSYELTEEEWDALNFEQKTHYPPVFDGLCNASHSNYYLCALQDHIQRGGKIPKRVWDSLHDDYKIWLNYCHTQHDPENIMR